MCKAIQSFQVEEKDGAIGLRWSEELNQLHEVDGFKLEFVARKWRESLKKAAMRETDEEAGIDSLDPKAVVVDLSDFFLFSNFQNFKLVFQRA